MPHQQSLSDAIAAIKTDLTVAAQSVFDSLDSLRPLPIPPRAWHPAPEEISGWKEGKPVPETNRMHFDEWLLRTHERTSVVEENKRRLRNVLWAHGVFTNAKRADYAEVIATFLATEWNVADPALGLIEREKQLRQVIRARTR